MKLNKICRMKAIWHHKLLIGFKEQKKKNFVNADKNVIKINSDYMTYNLTSVTYMMMTSV